MDWYPHHIDDYDADTLHLTLAEDGAYSRLLRWYYKNERTLPNDDQALAAICRIGLDEWLPISAKIKALFVTRDTRSGDASSHPAMLRHKRCDATILAQNKKRKDWRARQERLRKNGILQDVTRDTLESNAARGEERRGESPSSLRSEGVTPQLELVAGEDGQQDGKAKRKRKTSLTLVDLPEAWRLYALGQHHPDPAAEWERFRNYWLACGETKADWGATWRNWVLRAMQDGKPAVSRLPDAAAAGQPAQLRPGFAPWADQLRKTFGDPTLKSWFTQADLRDAGTELVLAVPTQFHQSHIRQQFETVLRPIFAPRHLQIVVDPTLKQASGEGEQTR